MVGQRQFPQFVLIWATTQGCLWSSQSLVEYEAYNLCCLFLILMHQTGPDHPFTSRFTGERPILLMIFTVAKLQKSQDHEAFPQD